MLRSLQAHSLLFQQIFFVLVCIHPGTPTVPPRVLASGHSAVAEVHKHAKKKVPISSHIDWTSLIHKGFIYGKSTPFSRGTQRVIDWAMPSIQNLPREKHRITHHYSSELQTAKQALTSWKHSVEFTYSDFPCHLKVNRDRLALINRRWKGKKGKRLTITAC